MLQMSLMIVVMVMPIVLQGASQAAFIVLAAPPCPLMAEIVAPPQRVAVRASGITKRAAMPPGILLATPRSPYVQAGVAQLTPLGPKIAALVAMYTPSGWLTNRCVCDRVYDLRESNVLAGCFTGLSWTNRETPVTFQAANKARWAPSSLVEPVSEQVSASASRADSVDASSSLNFVPFHMETAISEAPLSVRNNNSMNAGSFTLTDVPDSTGFSQLLWSATGQVLYAVTHNRVHIFDHNLILCNALEFDTVSPLTVTASCDGQALGVKLGRRRADDTLFVLRLSQEELSPAQYRSTTDAQGVVLVENSVEVIKMVRAATE